MALRRSFIVAAGFAVLCALVAPSAAVWAQQTPQRPAQTQTPPAAPQRPAQTPPVAAARDGQTFEDWIASCGNLPGTQTQRCVISQTLMNERQQRVLRVTMGYLGPNREPALVFELPLGVFLPAGAALRIDEGAQIPLTYELCTVEGCTAGMLLDAANLQAIRASRTLRIGFLVQAGGETVVLNVSPKGITAGLAALSPR